MSKWILSELVRIFHGVDTNTAEAAIDAIVERTIPVIWKVGNKYRILDTSTNMKEKTLLLLYRTTTSVTDKELFDWVEHSDISNYRRDVLRPLHREKYVEFDEITHMVHLSPKGVTQIEKVIFPKLVDYA